MLQTGTKAREETKRTMTVRCGGTLWQGEKSSRMSGRMNRAQSHLEEKGL